LRVKLKKTENQFKLDAISGENSHDRSIDHPFININNQYVVYALVVYKGTVKYFICDEVHEEYPFWYSHSIFEITDFRPSKYWIFSSKIEDYNDDITMLLTYSEWANNPSHYDNIVDGESELEKDEQKIFQKYKQLMDLEFPDPRVELKAIALEDGWAMCPVCNDAWQPHSQDGMIICPSCKSVVHNLYYKPVI
jgi:hypothetical protein